LRGKKGGAKFQKGRKKVNHREKNRGSVLGDFSERKEALRGRKSGLVVSFRGGENAKGIVHVVKCRSHHKKIETGISHAGCKRPRERQ